MEACITRCSSNIALFRAFKPLNRAITTNSIQNHPCRPMGIHTIGGQSIKRAYDALLLDAGGTLLQLVKPVEETYAAIGSKHGLTATPAEIKQGFKRAFAAPWPEKLRYQGDGRPFWKLVVSEATGCADVGYFEEVYQYYAQGDAWHLPDGAYDTIVILKDAGGYSCLLIFLFICRSVVFVLKPILRLRKLLKDLNVLDMFDAVVISSEVGYEKPDARIFEAALDQISVKAGKAIHVGDDQKADKEGANAFGIACWLLSYGKFYTETQMHLELGVISVA